VLTVFSPLAGLDGLYATFEINHISSVQFGSGGLHLSIWNGDTHLSVAHAGNFAPMITDGEVVRWTQAIEVKQGKVIFEIRGGTSTTWGEFGEDGLLHLERDSSLADLAGYSPTVSIGKSEVSFASNRVKELSMTRVRLIHASGNVDTDNAQKYVHLADQ
jgi:hypothetical protein